MVIRIDWISVWNHCYIAPWIVMHSRSYIYLPCARWHRQIENLSFALPNHYESCIDSSVPNWNTLDRSFNWNCAHKSFNWWLINKFVYFDIENMYYMWDRQNKTKLWLKHRHFNHVSHFVPIASECLSIVISFPFLQSVRCIMYSYKTYNFFFSLYHTHI